MTTTTVKQWSAIAASNVDLNGVPLDDTQMYSNQIDNCYQEMMAELAVHLRGGADVASAATLNLDNVAYLLANITGTTTTTAITMATGSWAMLVAAGAWPITASATLIVNGTTSGTYTCTGGELIMVRGYAASTVRVWVIPGGVLPTAATTAEVWAGTVSTKYVPPSIIQAALAEQTLTDGATVTVDFSAGINFKLTIGGNRSLAGSNLTNIVGRSGYIRITQDGTGSRTLNTTASPFVSSNGVDIVLSTTAGAVDIVYYHVISATQCILSLVRAIS